MILFELASGVIYFGDKSAIVDLGLFDGGGKGSLHS